jgi:hypothetical protein
MDKNLEKKNHFRKIWLAKILILSSSFASMIFSIYLFYNQDTQNGIFVGLWVPSILSAGNLLMVGSNEY